MTASPRNMAPDSGPHSGPVCGPVCGRVTGLLTGLIPIVTVTICTLWSIRIGAVPACLPFIDGCMSISAACRTPPVLYFFRGVMLPYCALLILYWELNDRSLRMQVPERVVQRRLLRIIAILGAVFLGLYVIFLGTSTPVYEFLRRVGVYVFFAGTGIAEMWTLLLLRNQRILEPQPCSHQLPVQFCDRAHLQRLRVATAKRLQSSAVLALLALGPLNLLFKAVLADPDAIENVIEWWFGLLMFLFPLLGACSATAITTSRR